MYCTRRLRNIKYSSVPGLLMLALQSKVQVDNGAATFAVLADGCSGPPCDVVAAERYSRLEAQSRVKYYRTLHQWKITINSNDNRI